MIKNLAFMLVCAFVLAGCSSQSGVSRVDNDELHHSAHLTDKTALYLLGDMDNWKPASNYQMNQISPRVFQVKVNFQTPGTPYRFKFSDAQWSPSLDFGGQAGNALIKLNKPVKVKAHSCLDELTFIPPQAGEYTFILDLRNRNQPVAQVTMVE